jgi:transcriptional regulator with XRE-family HTH domain
MASFGENLRRLRRERRLTQTALALAVGLSERSKGYVSELEHERKPPPSGEMLVKLAKLFDVSTDELLGLSDPKGGGVRDDH